MHASLTGAVMLGTALLCTGCGGGSSVGGVDGPCAPPPGTRTVLVYPAPGSTGIPDNVGSIVLGSSPALPPSYEVHVASSADQAALFNPVAAAPATLPSPSALPAFADPVYQASTNNGITFAAGSKVTVYLNNIQNSGYCLATLDLGSFVVR